MNIRIRTIKRLTNVIGLAICVYLLIGLGKLFQIDFRLMSIATGGTLGLFAIFSLVMLFWFYLLNRMGFLPRKAASRRCGECGCSFGGEGDTCPDCRAKTS